MEGIQAMFFSFCLLGVFLLLGKALRVTVRPFQALFLPASILGGFIALLSGPYLLNLLPAWVTVNWTPLPGLLINLVFACLFLGVALPGARALWSRGGAQLCFGMVIGLGQYAWALLVTALFLTPFFGVPAVFASILEIGFSGGHGTAAGMGEVFQQVGFPAGPALAQMSATVGIVTAVVGGILIINIVVRRGYRTLAGNGLGKPLRSHSGLLEKSEGFSIARATVAPESLEPLAFHFALVALAVLLGWAMLAPVRGLHPLLRGFPLFPLAMIGGLVIQLLAAPLRLARYLDRDTFERILGFSLEMLVVAAIATIRLDLFVAHLWPFVILMAVGIAWLFFAMLFLAPRMFPQFWLERGITEFGMQSGVTAMGLLLLRLVDPLYDTGTAEAFGFKQMVYEPILGGGLLTAAAPFLIIELGSWLALAICLGGMVLFWLISLLNGWFRFSPWPGGGPGPDKPGL
jgi:ESS family glutamate:Na+ symporter